MAFGFERRGASPARRRLVLAALIPAAMLSSTGATAAEGNVPVELRLPENRVLQTTEESPDAVVFSHRTHAALADNRCVTCHPQPFSILGRGGPIRHEQMDAGGSCGKCHNGNDATAVRDPEGCVSCHTGVDPPAGGKRAGPRDVTFEPSADSPGPVTFRHATHAQGSCKTCHPEPFAMKAGSTPLIKEAMYEGATCGRCHDGRTAFGVDDACERCHETEGTER